ncbi:MAG: hypothetical protein QOJ40_2949 [Verrucomicrobiota bacterium]
MKTESAIEAPTRKLQVTFQRLKANMAAHPFLTGLSPEHLTTLSDYAMDSQLTAGQLIFREGEIANRFYLILEGKVGLESRGKDGNPKLIQTLGAGEVLGWSWLFPPYTWHFDARVLEPTQAIFFYGTWLRDHCDQDRNFGYELMKRVAGVVIERLQKTRKGLLDPSCREGTTDRNIKNSNS